MMIDEIIGGALFGSLALMADGLHMSTHAGALLLAALAYTYARKYANDRRFSFGTGKFGDLAGYSSAIVLAMIALLIGYEAFARLLQPVAISFNEADPVAGFIGAVVTANWAVRLLRDTGGILLDRTPDPLMADRVRGIIEAEGDQVTDLHLWRLGPGHLGAIVSVATTGQSEPSHYRQRLARFADLSHVTVEVQHAPSASG